MVTVLVSSGSAFTLSSTPSPLATGSSNRLGSMSHDVLKVSGFSHPINCTEPPLENTTRLSLDPVAITDEKSDNEPYMRT